MWKVTDVLTKEVWVFCSLEMARNFTLQDMTKTYTLVQEDIVWN